MEKKFAEKAKEKDKKDGSDSDSDSDSDSEDGKKRKKPVGPMKLSDLAHRPTPFGMNGTTANRSLHRFSMKRHYAVKTYG
jgi:hypothetical protein